MTSNVGAELIRRQTTMGFGAPKDTQDYDTMRDKILEETKRVFKPEFLNRLDEIIVFHTLSKPDLLKIVDLEVDKVKRRLKLKEIEIVLDEPAHEFVINKDMTPRMSASDAACGGALSRRSTRGRAAQGSGESGRHRGSHGGG